MTTPQPATPLRILAVCLGNICRSPTAEAALREAAATAGVEVEVDSAGTGGWHVGAPPDPRMCRAAEAAGLRLAGEARQVTAEDLQRYDLVLAMDRSNLAELRRLAGAGPTDHIRLFRDFDPQADAPDVPDPYYGGADGFTEVVRIVRAAARGVIDHLRDEADR